jgi:polysaccharide export outer membrane protein
LPVLVVWATPDIDAGTCAVPAQVQREGIMAYRILYALGSLLLLAGCNTLAAEAPPMAASVSRTASDFSARTSYGAYILRPSDQVRVQVYDDPNITGEYQIDSSGFISIPLAGRVKASGLTPARLEEAIAARLREGMLKKPGVNVQIINYGPIYVHGEVKRAGDFPYKPGLTVMDAVALAGGYTYRADEGQAFVRRAGSNVEQVYPLDRRVPIYPGDNVRIPERFF